MPTNSPAYSSVCTSTAICSFPRKYSASRLTRTTPNLSVSVDSVSSAKTPKLENSDSDSDENGSVASTLQSASSLSSLDSLLIAADLALQIEEHFYKSSPSSSDPICDHLLMAANLALSNEPDLALSGNKRKCLSRY